MTRHSCPVRIRPASTFTVAKAEPSSRAPAVVPAGSSGWSCGLVSVLGQASRHRLNEQGSALTDPDAHRREAEPAAGAGELTLHPPQQGHDQA